VGRRSQEVDDERAREELQHSSKSYPMPTHSSMDENPMEAEDDDLLYDENAGDKGY
jgi:hypothetical protein